MEEFINQLLTNARGIWKYRWLAMGVSWLVAMAGWAAVTALPDDYQASARVYVDTQSILKPLLAGMTSVPNVEQQVAIMSRTLLSRPNVERVMRMADLDLAATSPREHERQLEELMGNIRIAGTGSYDIYTITYHHQDPKKVRDVVQALLAIFVEGSFKGKQADTQKAVQFIDEQIKTYEARLVAAENTLKEFKMQNSTLLPRQGVDYGAQLLQSADALGAARLELAEAEQSRDAILGQVAGAEAGGALAGAASPALDARIDAVHKNLDGLRLQYTELHPDIVAARRLLAQLEQSKAERNAAPAPRADPALFYSPMLQQMKVALTEADARVAAMRVRVRELGLRHDRLQRQSKAVPEVESQLAQLNRDYDVNKENYEKLLGKRAAARLSGDLSATTEMMNFRIIDPPAMPARPAGPNRPLYYSGALALGGVAALAASQARPTFLGAAELRAFTGLPVIGTVAMNWTPAQLARRRRGKAGFSAALATLLLGYGGVMGYALLLA